MFGDDKKKIEKEQKKLDIQREEFLKQLKEDEEYMQSKKITDTMGTGMFFISKCCHAYFQGVRTKEGELIVVCRKCGLFIGKISSDERYNGKHFWLSGL